MARKATQKTAPPRQWRAALYLRVSTGRRAEGDISIPSQRDLTTRYCQAQGWTVRDKLFAADRLADLLSTLAERREARNAAVNKRLVGLQAEVAQKTQMLSRLYNSIAAGIVELDDILGQRVAILKREREAAQNALDRALAQTAGVATLDPVKLNAFSELMITMLDQGDTAALRGYLRAVIDHVVVGDHAKIIGAKETPRPRRRRRFFTAKRSQF